MIIQIFKVCKNKIFKTYSCFKHELGVIIIILQCCCFVFRVRLVERIVLYYIVMELIELDYNKLHWIKFNVVLCSVRDYIIIY